MSIIPACLLHQHVRARNRGSSLRGSLYAGDFSWGRRQTRTDVDFAGRVTHIRRRRPQVEWTVLLHDRVPAYITWDRYLSNQRQLLENRRLPRSRGTPRGCSALLAGLLYCGRCGRKMQVEYRTFRLGRYSCSQRRFVPTKRGRWWQWRRPGDRRRNLHRRRHESTSRQNQGHP
jgi:hypothetical protein